MDCRTAEKLISLQPDGLLTIEESTALALHVANCRACAHAQQLQERLSRTLQEFGRFELEAPAELASLVMNRLKAERRSPFTYIPAAWRKTVAAAAALLLIAGSSAGVTGIFRMAGYDKTVALEPVSPTVLVDSGSGQTASGEPGGGTGTTGSGGETGIGDLPGVMPGDNPSERNTEGGINSSSPMTATPGSTISNSRSAGGETVMLSGGMKVISTVLRFAVDDMVSARAKAVSIAAGFGASNQVFPEQNNGKTIVVMRLTVDADKASDLISSLGRVGNVVDRQDESRDLTSIYNQTMVEYNDLLARQSTLQDLEEQRKLDVQVASYKQQLDAWMEEAGKRVIMVWLEGN